MRNVNVALWGFGAMASGIAKVLLEKEGVTVIGACDIDPRKIGKSIYELLGMEQGSLRGWIVTDFATPKLAGHIYGANFA